MCGIGLIYAYRPDAAPVDETGLLAMREAMRTRGPDDSGLWIAPDRRIGLAHRRLSIIDPGTAGAQPMTHGEGAYRIVYNGEIYNYRALRDELSAAGHVFRSDSDTEVLLHLYERDGPDMVRHLRGMYAFAIWDEARKGIFLARDPFGIKPLYYTDDGQCFRAASQVKALLAGGGVDMAADPAGHVGFFLWGYVPDPHTLFAAIHPLPAGHTLWVDGNGAATAKKFFDMSAEIAAAEAGSPAPADGQAILREALADSVRHHFVADVPVGVFLSAGLDSTTVAAHAAESQGAGIETLTLAFREFEGTAADEAPLAETVAAGLGTHHHTVRVDGRDFHAEADKLFAAMDQPTMDGVNTYFVSKAAADSDLKVALSGLGGDELFGGYASFDQIPALVRGLRPFAPLRGLGRAFRWVSAPMLGRMTSPKYAGLFEYGTEYAGAYLLRRGLFMPWEIAEILGPDMARAGWRALAPMARLETTLDRIASPRLRVSALETAWYMRNQLLRDADWAGMAHSVEIRVPLVDIDLFRTVLPLLAGSHPPTKLDMANSPAKALPPEILARPKTGFGVPVRDWLLEKGDQQDAAQPRGLRGWSRIVYSKYADARSSI